MRLNELCIKLTLLFTAIAVTGLGIFYSTDSGFFDAFYNRVATPKQSALILGTSRAAQGLIPDYLNKTLVANGQNKRLFNFSFTLASTPYGAAYLNLIKKKLDAKLTDGLFILAIDPWSVSSTTDELKGGKPREELNTLYKLNFVNSSPNLEYVFYENRKLGSLLFGKDKRTYLHTDGWLEVDIPADEVSIDKRTKEKVKEYKGNQQKFHFSAQRFEYFKQTISYLKNYGRVVLVRLPVSSEIKIIENEYMPDFKEQLNAVSHDQDVPVIDLFESTLPFIFTDGNHLAIPSATQVSKMVADSLTEVIKEQKHL